MGAKSRRKGAGAEREFAAVLFDWLGVRLTRNLAQSRAGGHDLVVDDEGPAAEALGRFAIEVKRHARVTHANLKDWWRQAGEQARRCGKVPALAYRADRQPWQVLIPLAEIHSHLPAGDSLDYCAVLSVEGFAAVIREIHIN
ncbi:MAG: hypothetical protein AXA67_02140 [Methylothermaceae bacteria B42]|nr:MAG: hypothetical protein AXA67_02140 [Methylothermaceae bacteria B42]HHJ40062.1 hypothetical protein [Methylothermaceae bacterium]